MTVTEALRLILDDPGLWMRPVTWRGLGFAITVNRCQNKGCFDLVPNSGLSTACGLRVADVMEDWEVIKATEVLQERR